MTLPQFKGIEVHPAANIFPMMDDAAFADLVADIKENGQRESCSLYKGQLIDGRNRWLACQELGIEPQSGEFEDDDFDVLAFVLSANLHRRHLDEGQRAMVAARIEELFKPAAKERQKRKPSDSVSENLREQTTQPTNGKVSEQAGAALNVSGRTVDHARTVLRDGSQDLIAAVERGDVSVSKAATVAKTTPKREQLQAATAPREKPKKKTPLQQLKHWWGLSDAAAQHRFRLWIDGEE